jgi:hypothetical protein
MNMMKLQLVAFAMCVLAFPMLCLAQSSSSPEPTLPPGSINGANTPELISDTIAYRLVFRSLSISANPTVAEHGHQDIRLAALGFSDADKSSFKAVMADFRATFKILQAASASTAAADWAKQHDDLIQHSRDQLAQKLSPEAMKVLAAYVAGEKRRMIVVTPPPMSMK